MLIRICLIVAIVAGLAVGALNFTKVKEKITTLQTNLATETAGRQKAEGELRQTRKELEDTTTELKTTKGQLEETTAEKDKAVAEAAKRIKEAEELTTQLAKTTSERNEAQENLGAYRATGFTVEQIVAAKNRMQDLQANLDGTQKENKVLGQRIVRLQNELDRYTGDAKPVALPVTARGKVIAFDPKYNFVVIDVGENQGVLEYGEMLINRNGKLVAKVIVRNVQKDKSVANVLPGWGFGEVMEGDQVIPAHPAS